MVAFRCDNVRAGMLIEFVEIRLTRALEEDAEKVYVARRQSHPRIRLVKPHQSHTDCD